MPVNGILEITGLSHAVADAGIPIGSLPKISNFGGVVTDFSIIWGGDGLPPSDGAIGLQGFPYSGAGAIATGTDSNGSIGVAKSFTIGNDAGTLWLVTSGSVVLADGFWDQDVRVFINDVTGTRRIRIDILALELADFSENGSFDTPDTLIASNPSWDPVDEDGSVDLDWTYTDGGDNPEGFVIIRDGVIVGSVPANKRTYRDHFQTPGTKTYTVRTYKYPSNVVSPPSPPTDVIVGGDSPDISVTSDMGLAFEWNSIMAFITDPSGIYGLIPNKTHDTLYNRAVETSIDVKIPDPFVKLGFLPED